ncbi:carbon-nitrogen hydrolase family protein [Galbitalea soli]|uniref:Carbon-nitrogen hydrolase family protein n=1 Tax=Galbitalea soli TaxID=1268042 RepID=A0A7C9PLX2_9MICO|nr:carbon-nitrogen hydrolase family protein [Galbitalea soli]NEM90573.1 carbon-nitrogen hydrolase family protein [Galbitalea soli]NYJ31289.1 putative amidohydrolase [Galbitalea soli]
MTKHRAEVQAAPGDPSIAVAQFAPGSDPAANAARLRALAERAARRGAGLVVFPEYSSFFAPTLGRDFVDAAQPIHGHFIEAVADVAADLGVLIVVGLVEQIDDPNRFSNTLVALSDQGEFLSAYRKLHLYDAFGDRESEWVRPGPIEAPRTFHFEGFTVGLQTCYDLRFPEVTRRLADAGVDLVLVPSEWVRGPLKEHHWRTLVTARALENTLYVAAADHMPPVGVGNSMIVDPMGVELATVGETEGVGVAEISLARVEEVRAINPALELRRFRVTTR